MLTIYNSDQRAKWKLPCFENEQYVILSDSQFRDLRHHDLHRYLVEIVISGQK